MCGAAIDDKECKPAAEEWQLLAARRETLAEVLQALAKSGLDAQAALNTIAWQVAERIGDFCAVHLVSEDGNWLQQVAYHHPNPEIEALMVAAFLGNPLPVGAYAVVSDAVRIGQGRLVPEVDQAELKRGWLPDRVRLLEQIGIHSLLIVPLRADGRVIGVLFLTRDRPGRPYAADDRLLLQDLADRAALTVQNALLFQQLRAAHQRLEALSGQLLEAQENERRAIARELHDEVGQVLTAVGASLQAIQIASNQSALDERLAEGIQMVDEALGRIPRPGAGSAPLAARRFWLGGRPRVVSRPIGGKVGTGCRLQR